MESAETLIASKLESARKELAETEERRRRAEKSLRERSERRRQTPDALRAGVVGGGYDEVNRLTEDIRDLTSRVQVLAEIKGLLASQHAETKAQFVAIEQRDRSSSKQGFWLTVASSAVSLIIGWLLSLVGSPATMLHLFAH